MSWKETQDSEGRTYYINEETQQSSWEKPDELLTNLEKVLAKTHWSQYTSESGSTYFHNSKTNESVWEIPTEVKEQLDAIENSDSAKAENGDTSTSESNQLERSNIDLKTLEKYENSSNILQERLTPKDGKNAEDLFIEMLRENHVDATWSFNKIIDYSINDQRYWLIDDSLTKKQLFERYLNSRTREELLKESQSVEKFKDAFLKLLQNDSNIKYYTTWKTAKNLIKNEPIYVHSVISEKVKRQTFNDYIASLKKVIQDDEDKKREQALSELKEYFKIMNLNLYSTWDSTLEYIKNDKRFEQNTHFQILNQLDLINLFEETMIGLQNDYKERIQKTITRNYRSDRKARDEYRSLLIDLKESGLLRADTKWVDIFSLIKEDDRFINLLGRNGSNPIELFWDLIDEEERLIRAKKDIVEQLLIHLKFVVRLDGVDLDEQKVKITELLQNDQQTKDYDEDTIDLIYSKILKDLKDQKDRDKFAVERRLRRLQEEFRSFLKRFGDPIITIDTKWEDVKPKIEPYKEYQALETDELRVLTFDKYIHRLAEKKIEIELNKERELRRVLEEANSTNKEIPRKRPRSPIAPVVELDY